MSVYLYEGVPGSGKTYRAVSDAYYFQGPVITNIELTGLKNALTVPLDMINPLMLQNFAEWWWSFHEFREDGILLIIDECQQLFNSREGLSKEDKDERLENVLFTTRSRKFGFRIIYICQQREMLDKQMRNCVESVFNFQIVGAAIPLAKLLPFTFGRVNRFLGIDSNKRISRDFYFVRKKFYRFYDTRQDCVFTELPYADISFYKDGFKNYSPNQTKPFGEIEKNRNKIRAAKHRREPLCRRVYAKIILDLNYLCTKIKLFIQNERRKYHAPIIKIPRNTLQSQIPVETIRIDANELEYYDIE